MPTISPFASTFKALYFLAGHLDFEFLMPRIISSLILRLSEPERSMITFIHHQFGDFMLVGVLSGLGHHKLAVLQNGNPVGNLHDLVKR